ncbi:right-handed parallel beta-helix repeat-containing protein [Lentzea sp. NPDC005914]|uniref:right-handed parallel beta-helix repeat-containing protein n=1 Tax=Lentzea sp. NPDC005914 TaxID=3154572 RepID=UPI0033F77877
MRVPRFTRHHAAVLAATVALATGPVTATPAPPVLCGDTVTSDITLSADLHCPGPGLIVKAGNVVLNLNGHSITGSGTGSGISVTGQSGVRIQNGKISKFDYGVFFAESADSELADLTIADNVSRNVLTVDRSTNIKLTNDKIRRGRVGINTTAGLTVSNSEFTQAPIDFSLTSRSPVISGSKFVDSDIFYSQNANNGSLTASTLIRSGVGLREADGLTVSGNVFNQGYIRVLNGCRDTTITDNRFSNGDRAVFVQQATSSANLRITGNRFTGNQIGVDASDLSVGMENGITISENTFTDNAVAGILLESPSYNSVYWARIAKNTLTSNGKRSGGRVDSAGRPINDGIHVNVPAGSPVEITGNITRRNADYGIEAVPGSVTDGGGNTSSGNPSGCLGVTCT